MTTGVRRSNTSRDQIWNSIRILRRFTLSALVMTSDAGMSNCKKYIRQLVKHGVVAEIPGYVGGRAGDRKGYRLAIDSAKRPVSCAKCGRRITDPECGKKEGDHDNR